MNNCLIELQYENIDCNILYTRNRYNPAKNDFKNCRLNKNYFGKGNFIVDEYNRKKEEEEFDDKFAKTKNKIKLVVFRDGFIVNNGPFRDSSLRENYEFLKSVRRGLIPQEYIRKGIKDLGILLINRYEERYHSRLCRSLPPSFDYFDLSDTPKNYEEHILDQFFRRNGIKRADRDDFFYSQKTPEIPKCFRMTDLYERSTSPKIKDIKCFSPFNGNGKLLATTNVKVTDVEKTVPNYIDKLSPICTINILLFNGEIIKQKFNSNEVLRDVYLYVRRVTGSNNFTLTEGFPPTPLNDYEKTIGELNLQNSLLTQTINYM